MYPKNMKTHVTIKAAEPIAPLDVELSVKNMQQVHR